MTERITYHDSVVNNLSVFQAIKSLLDPPGPGLPVPRAGVGRRELAARDQRTGHRRLRLRPLVRARRPGHVAGRRLREGDRLFEAADYQETASECVVVGNRRPMELLFVVSRNIA